MNQQQLKQYEKGSVILKGSLILVAVLQHKKLVSSKNQFSGMESSSIRGAVVLTFRAGCIIGLYNHDFFNINFIFDRNVKSTFNSFIFYFNSIKYKFVSRHHYPNYKLQ